MLNPSTFRDLVSGRRRGPGAALLRAGLRVAEVPYSTAMRVRNWRFDQGYSSVHQVGVPVISIGNLTLGGTGKTPLVEWIARHFRTRGVRVSIVSRGYGAEQGERNDEALELELALPDVPHLQNPDRVEAAQIAIEELETELILLDDGFQHRRLARELDIVLLDATEPFGNEHVFPRGTLRESPSSLARAQVVLLSRADMLSAESRQRVQARVARLAPQAVWCEVTHQPHALLDASGLEHPLANAQGQRVAAFCGVGNPSGFRHTLETLGYELCGWREFPDHHSYTRADVEMLTEWAKKGEIVLCTRKDLVKLGVESLGTVPLRAVGVQLNFLKGEEALVATLQNLAAQEIGSGSCSAKNA